MPFTVITLKKVPNSLRGDLTRWMQEIATGVYVGSFNSKVREYLWKRVTDTVGQGEAAMCFSCRNEIGYSFCTCNTERQIVDYDGIPLVLIPTTGSSEYDNNNAIPHGFSSASNFQHAHKTVKPRASKDRTHLNDIVFLDIETSGLDADHDQIIEIGAVRLSGEHETEFHRMIQADTHLSDIIINLTGITDEMLKDGTTLEASMQDLDLFIRDAVLIGYNIAFDIKFLNKAFDKLSMESIHNRTVDLLREAKRKDSFQENYKFETTLKEYGIDKTIPHRALEDAKLMHLLYKQMDLHLRK